MKRSDVTVQLAQVHRELDACRACPGVVGPVVHGPAVISRVFLIGQAPGPHEAKFNRPFAWTAGKTLFRWLEETLGAPEEEVRRQVYMAAVARCFPGKDKGGSDRKPSPGEIANCQPFLRREVTLLRPKLVLPVGSLAIEQVLGRPVPLAEVVGKVLRQRYHGLEVDVLALPHPSGASTWHRLEPGVTLLRRALRQLARHPEIQRAFKPAASLPGRGTRR